jgi:hypothetical protein
MLNKTYKNPTYIEVATELQKQESSFNWEIYNFDELIKKEKILKIIDFIKEQLMLILENEEWKKVVIQLIKWEENYFASVININSEENVFNNNNKKQLIFDGIKDFWTVKTIQKINQISPIETINKKILLNYFTWEIDWKKSYIISNPEWNKYFLAKNYNLKSNFSNKKLPEIEEYLSKKSS